MDFNKKGEMLSEGERNELLMSLGVWPVFVGVPVNALQATGAFVFAGVPDDGDYFEIADVRFTARTSATLANEFEIGLDEAACCTNAAAAVLASDLPVSAVADDTTLTLTADQYGIAGDSITLARDGLITAAEATLTGGQDATSGGLGRLAAATGYGFMVVDTTADGQPIWKAVTLS